MNYLEQEGFDYRFDPSKCAQCEGDCCIGEPGHIWISSKEITVLAQFLNIEPEELIHQYLKKVGYKYTIKERVVDDSNYACLFFDLENKRCSIYEARPKQCRTFPFWDHFKVNKEEVFKECPAVSQL